MKNSQQRRGFIPQSYAIPKENSKTELLILSGQDARDFIENILDERLKALQPLPQPTTDSEKYLTIPEAVKYLKISRPTLTKLRRQGAINVVHLNKRVFVPKSEIEKYFQSQLTN